MSIQDCRLLGIVGGALRRARSNNTQVMHHDGGKLRRYRRRWIVERTFAWLGAFRRLLVRHERLLVTYAGVLYGGRD